MVFRLWLENKHSTIRWLSTIQKLGLSGIRIPSVQFTNLQVSQTPFIQYLNGMANLQVYQPNFGELGSRLEVRFRGEL